MVEIPYNVKLRAVFRAGNPDSRKLVLYSKVWDANSVFALESTYMQIPL